MQPDPDWTPSMICGWATANLGPTSGLDPHEALAKMFEIIPEQHQDAVRVHLRMVWGLYKRKQR